MGKIKILYVHQISSIGGASFCLLSILKSLNRDEYEPVVLLKCNGPLVDELKNLKYKFISCQSCAQYLTIKVCLR